MKASKSTTTSCLYLSTLANLTFQFWSMMMCVRFPVQVSPSHSYGWVLFPCLFFPGFSCSRSLPGLKSWTLTKTASLWMEAILVEGCVVSAITAGGWESEVGAFAGSCWLGAGLMLCSQFPPNSSLFKWQDRALYSSENTFCKMVHLMFYSVRKLCILEMFCQNFHISDAAWDIILRQMQ